MCYCPLVKPFESYPRFVILIHPREAKHRFGTGRMAHLCVSNSVLIEGVDFSAYERVETLIRSPNVLSVILYPGDSSISLSKLSGAQTRALVPPGKQLFVFVLDGTWRTARKMIRLSRNLHDLTCVSFNPPTPSAYRIRRQPRPHCYSTLEAIHHVIDLFALPDQHGGAMAKPHDNLLEVFNFAVNQQLRYTP